MNKLNDNFLDAMSCMGFAIGLMNLKENMEQTDNNGLMKALDQKTNMLLKKLEFDLQKQDKVLQQQNELLENILKKLETKSYDNK